MNKIITHIFSLLYKLYILIDMKMNYKNKIYPDTKTSNQKISMCNNEIYYVLTQHIRNIKTLTDDEITFIQTLPNENLFDIILLYNKNSEFMNDFIINL